MLTKDNRLRVLRLFFENPEKKFHIRELSRLTKLSPPGILKIVKNLSNEGLLTTEKNKVVTNISSSRTEKFMELKRAYNIISLHECGLVSFLRREYEEPEAIILFGSYSKGEDISTSDIDIAIVTKKHVKLDLKKFESALKRKINMHEIRLVEAEDVFLNSLANGIVLYGYLKVL